MTTTANIIENHRFVFRTKFRPLLTEENQKAIVAGFTNFCSLQPDTTDARDLLWKMTYSIESASDALNELGIDSESFSSEIILKFRDELRHQYYTNTCASYLEKDVTEEFREPFNALSKKDSSITASVVFDQARYHLYQHDVERTLYLLESKKEEYYYGGLRNMGFSPAEASYLKIFHMEVYNLLKKMWDSQQEKNADKNSPFDGLDKLLQDSGIELPFSTEAEVTASSLAVAQAETANEAQDETMGEASNTAGSIFRALTLEAILEHRESFDSVANHLSHSSMVAISVAGFDLNEVIPKLDAIQEILKAAEANDAAEKLLQVVILQKQDTEKALLKAAEALKN